MWQIQSAVTLSLQNNHSVTFDTIFNFISYGVLMNYQTNTVFSCVSCLPYLFGFAYCAVPVNAHLTLDSLRK